MSDQHTLAMTGNDVILLGAKTVTIMKFNDPQI